MALMFDDDSYNPPVRSSDGWGTSSDPAPAGTSPSYGSVFGVLDQVATGINKVATTVQQFRTQQSQIELNQARLGLETYKAQAGIDIARAQTGGAVDVERLRTQAEIAKAQRDLQSAQGMNIFQTPQAPRDWLMLALAAAGVWFAWRAAK
jgi:hypothetical protein